MLCLVLLGLFSFFGTGVWRGALRDPWQTCGASDVIRGSVFQELCDGRLVSEYCFHKW